MKCGDCHESKVSGKFQKFIDFIRKCFSWKRDNISQWWRTRWLATPEVDTGGSWSQKISAKNWGSKERDLKQGKACEGKDLMGKHNTTRKGPTLKIIHQRYFETHTIFCWAGIGKPRFKRGNSEGWCIFWNTDCNFAWHSGRNVLDGRWCIPIPTCTVACAIFPEFHCSCFHHSFLRLFFIVHSFISFSSFILSFVSLFVARDCSHRSFFLSFLFCSLSLRIYLSIISWFPLSFSLSVLFSGVFCPVSLSLSLSLSSVFVCFFWGGGGAFSVFYYLSLSFLSPSLCFYVHPFFVCRPWLSKLSTCFSHLFALLNFGCSMVSQAAFFSLVCNALSHCAFAWFKAINLWRAAPVVHPNFPHTMDVSLVFLVHVQVDALWNAQSLGNQNYAGVIGQPNPHDTLQRRESSQTLPKRAANISNPAFPQNYFKLCQHTSNQNQQGMFTTGLDKPTVSSQAAAVKKKKSSSALLFFLCVSHHRSRDFGAYTRDSVTRGGEAIVCFLELNKARVWFSILVLHQCQAMYGVWKWSKW